MFPWFPLDRLDRYVLRLIAGPMALSLVALLLAQLLERLLRLFDLAASAGAPPSSVLVMASTLVPHYLGLALPMAFTAAIFMAVAHMCDDNELDMMLVAGRSIARIAAPYFMLALMLSLFSVYLYGQLQPLARYGYHVAVNQVLQTGWDARVEENHFIDIGQGVTFTADVIEPDGRGLRGVFMERRGSHSEQILTAARGRIVPTPEGLQLKLEDGLVVNENEHKASLSISRFETGFSANDFTPKPEPMEARGASVRERTLAELWRDMHLEGGETKPAAEFHSRLARALIFPFLPLLALPLEAVRNRDSQWAIQTAVIALRDNLYRADELKSQKDNGKNGVKKIAIAVDSAQATAAKATLSQSVALANGMDLAKTLGNLPPNICTPTYLASTAKKLAKDFKLGVEVLDRKQLEALKMGSFLSVTNGSEEPPKFIVLKHMGGKSKEAPVVLVGKGITFDTGGISIKPAAEMDEMKFDMGGAASVLRENTFTMVSAFMGSLSDVSSSAGDTFMG